MSASSVFIDFTQKVRSIGNEFASRADALAAAYVLFVIGLPADQIEPFINLEKQAIRHFAETENSTRINKRKLRFFWESVQKLFPGLFSEAERELLIRNGTLDDVKSFLNALPGKGTNYLHTLKTIRSLRED